MTNETHMDPQALAQQVMNAANSLTDEEAAQRYQQILAQLPPDQAAELNTLALSQVHANDRQHIAAQFKRANQDPNSPFDGYQYDNDHEAANPANLGRMTARAQQQDPNLLGGILGNNSSLGGQIGKAALAALAALLIRRMMSGQGGGYGQSTAGGSGAIGSILGSLLGGGGSGGYGNSGYGSNDPIGSVLGGLLGGGGGGGSYGGQPIPQPSQSAPGGIDLGGLLGGLLGGGGVAQQMPQGGGLGGLLGSILGGASGGGAAPAAPEAPGAGTHRKQGVHLGNE